LIRADRPETAKPAVVAVVPVKANSMGPRNTWILPVQVIEFIVGMNSMACPAYLKAEALVASYPAGKRVAASE